jgi:hypothetical protein
MRHVRCITADNLNVSGYAPGILTTVTVSRRRAVLAHAERTRRYKDRMMTDFGQMRNYADYVKDDPFRRGLHFPAVEEVLGKGAIICLYSSFGFTPSA